MKVAIVLFNFKTSEGKYPGSYGITVEGVPVGSKFLAFESKVTKEHPRYHSPDTWQAVFVVPDPSHATGLTTRFFKVSESGHHVDIAPDFTYRGSFKLDWRTYYILEEK